MERRWGHTVAPARLATLGGGASPEKKDAARQAGSSWGGFVTCEHELELIKSQMPQKPVLWGEVGAHALRVRSVSREGVWASAGVQGAWVSVKPNSNSN